MTNNVNFSLTKDFLDYQLVNNIILFINVIICLSYPLNFAIYCGMSRYICQHIDLPFLPLNKLIKTYCFPPDSSGRRSGRCSCSRRCTFSAGAGTRRMTMMIPPKATPHRTRAGQEKGFVYTTFQLQQKWNLSRLVKTFFLISYLKAKILLKTSLS